MSHGKALLIDANGRVGTEEITEDQKHAYELTRVLRRKLPPEENAHSSLIEGAALLRQEMDEKAFKAQLLQSTILEGCIINEADQPIPLIEGVADGCGDWRLSRHLGQPGLAPGFQRLGQWLGFFLADGFSLFGGLAASFGFDGVKGGDPLQRVLGDGRGFGDIKIGTADNVTERPAKAWRLK